MSAAGLPRFKNPPIPSLSATELNGSKLPSKLITSIPMSSKERVRKMFDKVELSSSAYDTAWVAMLPCPNSPELACFPQCVQWVADNQLGDGSWGLLHRHPSLLKDALSSTLACVLALKQWGLADQLVDKGLQFIGSNSSVIFDPKQQTPIGFDITFPSMLEHAKSLNLNVPLQSSDFNAMSDRRASEPQSGYCSNMEGREAYLTYVSEGMGSLQDWEMAIKYKRKNGSLFSSPSATAAAFRHLHDPDCLHYLNSVVHKFGGSVPTIYPLHIYPRLCMVDTLERLWVGRHFREEMKAVLDETYIWWLQGEEEIFLDPATCAMAFRILRINGYDVSSDVFVQCIEDYFFNSLGGYIGDVGAALEVYKASQITFRDEKLMEKHNLWATQFLRQDFSSGATYSSSPAEVMAAEVKNALKFPYRADLQRLTSRSIKRSNSDCTRVLKSSYSCPNLGNGDFLDVAIEDFNMCQSVHREELEQLERWVVDMKLDKLMFARQKHSQCYRVGAAIMFEPELSDARISLVKSAVVATFVDDFFDVGGSEEELTNLVKLIEKWHIDWRTDFCSETVEIVFAAIHNTVCEIADKALPKQRRDVTSHVVEIWLDLVKSMLKEAEWARTKSAPTTLDEYMDNAYVSFALGPVVLSPLYLVGPELSEAAIRSPEYRDMFKCMSICGRLLNDLTTFERESRQGKPQALSLLMSQDGDGLTEDEAIERIKATIGSNQLKLRELVLREMGGNPIPRACRNLFSGMLKVLHLVYAKDDGFTGNGILDAANVRVNLK